MKKKGGRTSAAAREVLAANPAIIEPVQRPDAPYDLTDEQATEWWGVVNRMPSDWFPRETHGLLAQYCRHVVCARRVSQLVRQAESAKQLNLDRYDQLLRMQEREGRALSALAVKMRLSQSASMRIETTHKGDVLDVPPWDYGR